MSDPLRKKTQGEEQGREVVEEGGGRYKWLFLLIPLLLLLLILASIGAIFFLTKEEKDPKHNIGVKGVSIAGGIDLGGLPKPVLPVGSVPRPKIPKELQQPYQHDDFTPTMKSFNKKQILTGLLKIVGGKTKDDRYNFTSSIAKCVETGGVPAVPFDAKMVQKILNLAEEESSKSDEDLICSNIFLGLRFTLNDWYNEEGTLRLFNGVVSSLWHPELYNTLHQSTSKCSVIANVEGVRLLSPHPCGLKGNCHLCEKDNSSCPYGICYSLYSIPVTTKSAETKCKLKNSRLAVPSNLPLLSEAIKVIRESEDNLKCINTTVGFVRRSSLEDYMGNPVAVDLEPFDEALTSLKYSCVGINTLFQEFFRLSCEINECVICSYYEASTEESQSNVMI